MRFGLNVINAWPAEYLLQLAIAADNSGWDGFFLWDHVAFEFPATLQDPWVLLGAIAARTSRLRLGTLVTPLARRRPHVVAKETVTLDHLSKGRSVLGVGLGGTELEFAAFGDEVDAKIRAERLDEALEVITKLWSGEHVEHYGRYYTVSRISFAPTPVQKPRIPIWVGGHSKAAQRRASRYDGWAPGGTAPSVGEAGMGLEELRESIAYILKHREKGNLEPF